MSNIKVAVRIRPLSEREVSVTGSEIVVHTDGNELLLTNLKVSASKAGDSRKRTRRYGFDYCFNSSLLDSEVQGSQERVYDIIGKSALDAIFSGFNACLVAYGQSASGKTYTMMGPKNDPGLTPRLCEGLFLRILDQEKNGGQYYETVVSYLEIYNERVRDLLKPSSSNSGGLRVREHPKLGPYVQGLTRHTVSTLSSLMSYVEEGTRARKTASTSQNLSSSRSHALLTVSIASRADNSCATVSTASTTGLEKKQQHAGRGARLHLVDLAGSERAGNSNYGLHRLKEGANINKSLVALGNVISALAERGATGSGPGRRFIPYRDSALTWLLKDALGGNATTIMLATISPASGSYNETAHTLRFAQRAQSVVNRPVVNEDPVARVIRELRAEIARLTSLLSEKETVPIENLSCCCKKQFGRDSEEESCAQVNRVVEKTVESIGRSQEFGRAVSSVSPLHRRYSSDESLSSSKLTNDKAPVISPRRFGSLRSLEFDEDAVFRNSEDAVESSTVTGYDRVSSLALVDIPTLVAVLIKPEGDTTSSVQIEEISSENILEETATEDPEELDPSEFDDREKTTASIADYSEPEEDLEDSKFHSKEAPVLCLGSKVEKNSVKPNGIEAVTHKKSSSLNGSKKFGSSESFDSVKKTETPCTGLGRRSYTNLQLDRSDRNGKHANSVANLSKSKRSWGSRGPPAWAPPKKSDPGDKEKDTVKEAAVDSERASKDLGPQKARNSLKKQDSESPKRKFSRDGTPGIPKDELTGPSGAPKLVRKGSVPGEVSWRTQTPIHRSNRRAEIVAAVTERLYSTKKATEELSSTTPSTSSLVPEFRSPESTEVKLANTTRMKLQEISRKMLAKRRKTCADTQTDAVSTVRVKDAASLTENPEIETKDASVITDVHEECSRTKSEGDETSRVIRVKEIATLTERFAETTIRCADAEVLTDEWKEEGESVPSNAAINPETDVPRLVECSTNTTWVPDNGRSSGSQTVPQDVLPDCKKSHVGDCGRCHSVRSCCYQPLTLSNLDRSVICITLPDMLSITIESPNPLESKIAVSEGLDDKVRIKLTDGETQTERKISETTNSCSDVTESEKLDDLSGVVTTRSTSCQSDGRTFRIENIFKDQKPKTQSTAELLPDLTEHVVPKTSLKLTNSVGTFFGPETSERSTEIEGFNLFDYKMRGVNEKSKLFSQITNVPPCRGADPSRLQSCYAGVQPKSDRSKIEPQPQPHLKQELVVGAKSASIPRYTNYGEGRPSVSLKSSSVARIEAEDLKSPLLVARLIASGSCNTEMDSSFSDDSLDPEDAIPENLVSKRSASSRLDDSLCPPDVVAHTKKEQVYDSRLEDDFADEVIEFPKTSVDMPDPENAPRVHDYESLVLGRNCFLPALASQDSGGSNSSRMETPESEEGRNPLKKKVSFSNSQTPDRLRVKDPRKPKPIIKNKFNSINQSERYPENKENHSVEVKERCSNYFQKTEKLRASSTPLECSASENSFRDDDVSSISGSSETIRSGAMYNSDEDSDVNSTQRSGEDSDTKRVRFTTLLFGDLVESGTSDSEGCCEATVSDDDNFSCNVKTEDFTNRVFASYLDEATAFVHNMNTVNDYVNASKLFREQDEYIEYEGCRISLRDDTEDYLKDQKFSVPLDSYNSCLRGIEELENCIERAVKHDKYLIDKYGIHSESAATRFRLVDPGKDSINSFHALNKNFQNPDELGSTSSIEDATLVTDENSSDLKERDLESRIYDQLMSSSAPRRRSILRVNKPYFRRSTRMSDLTGSKSPTSSRLRKKEFTDFDNGFLSPGELPRHEWLGTSDSGSPQSNSEELIDETRGLKAPKCFLVVPEPGKSISSGKELYRSDGGTSSSEAVATSSESIDTVASVRNKFRYPGSPRAKLLQLVSERRQIVHRSRSGNSPG
ncbi:uncharacterized protein LOC105683614 isoform X2 [Athalia rosae]|uniref:uncharacterized protein LOC105683614 isoform X2 n=1 Tax=Athalia rosae TaxID=37344 RepID=UPI002033B1E5|nr:uncharacterized protein LOC105683614 isoform X2 [Athalia rosae]